MVTPRWRERLMSIKKGVVNLNTLEVVDNIDNTLNFRPLTDVTLRQGKKLAQFQMS